jgi:hypothetical protein
MNLRYDKSNEGNTIQILLYFKIPNIETSDIIITITSNDLIDLKDLKIGGSTEDYLYKTLSNQTPSYSIEGDKTKTSDNIYELTLSSSNISSLKSDNNNYIYIDFLLLEVDKININIKPDFNESSNGNDPQPETEPLPVQPVIEDGEKVVDSETETIFTINETSSEEAKKHPTYYPIRTIYSNKPTGFNLNLENRKAVRISFIYLPGYKLFFTDTFLEINSDFKNSSNSNFQEFLSYRNRRTYILGFDAIPILRFYFIPPSYQSKRFLQERILLDISTSTELKYETANSVDDFKIYLNSSNLTVSEDAQNNKYIVTVTPITSTSDDTNDLLTKTLYTLKIYNKESVTESQINFSKTTTPYKSYNATESDSSKITFEIKSLEIKSGNYYLSVTAITDDFQIIDYDLLSYKLINKEDGGIKYDTGDVIQEKDKKKSKWWIALIVIGALIIIAAIIFAVKKLAGNKRGNSDYDTLRAKEISQNQIQNENEVP